MWNARNGCKSGFSIPARVQKATYDLSRQVYNIAYKTSSGKPKKTQRTSMNEYQRQF